MGCYMIHIGEIAPAYQENWAAAESPFDITTGRDISFSVSICDGMQEAREFLHDEQSIDWGSWAWRGTKEEIEKTVKKAWPNRDISLEQLEDGKEYALVYIEMY